MTFRTNKKEKYLKLTASSHGGSGASSEVSVKARVGTTSGETGNGKESSGDTGIPESLVSTSDWISLSVPSVPPSVENALSSAAALESCCS